MCIATLAASAVYGPAQKERDDRQTVSVQGNQVAVPLEGDLRALRMGAAFCDGQHCDIGTAASVGPDYGAFVWPSMSMVRDTAAIERHLFSLQASLWLLQPSMYVPADGLAPERLPVDSVLPTDPTTAPVPVAQRVAGQVDWRTLIEQWDDWSPDVMLRIMRCESGFDPNAMSPDRRNWGAYQLNVVHGWTVEQMTDPVTSTALAHDVWLSQGYRAWSCY